MRNRRALWIGGIALALLGGIFVWRSAERSPAGGMHPAPPATSRSEAFVAGPASDGSPPSPRAPEASPDSSRATSLSRTPEGYLVWPDAEATSKELNQPDESAREDIQAVHTMLSDYHKVFGETPPGGLNEEITRGLLGDNPKKIIFLTVPKSGLSKSGALLDRWGTPYFFHKLSRDIIDLRTAGPDRKMFTNDDIFERSTGGPPL